MKVLFSDSLAKSIKRLIWHEHWLYKTYSFFRWDIWHFFKNIWRFRKELWNHQWWDYRYTLNMLERSLTIMEAGMNTKGMEVTETREPKVKAMRRALELLRNNREDYYIQKAEDELGKLVMKDWSWKETGETTDNPMGEKNEKLYELVDTNTEEENAHNKKVFERAREIEDTEWKELWEIFKGTKSSKSYNKKYDGTDMRSWWD